MTLWGGGPLASLLGTGHCDVSGVVMLVCCVHAGQNRSASPFGEGGACSGPGMGGPQRWLLSGDSGSGHFKEVISSLCSCHLLQGSGERWCADSISAKTTLLQFGRTSIMKVCLLKNVRQIFLLGQWLKISHSTSGVVLASWGHNASLNQALPL